MAKLQGGRLLASCLRQAGLGPLFVHGSGHLQPLLQGASAEGVQLVETHHSEVAGYAADALGRVRVGTGVVLVDAGPGITAVLGSLGTALRNAVPLLCLGATPPTSVAGLGAFMELDALRVVRGVTKWCARVSDVSRLADTLATALRIARAGSPGPVFVEVPIDVLLAPADDLTPLAPAEPRATVPAPEVTALLHRLLSQSERPCFIIGSQYWWSPRQQALRGFADRFAAAYFLNGMARGALPQGHPHLFHQSRKRALLESDLVVVLGTPLDFRLGYGREGALNASARLVHICSEHAELSRTRQVDLALAGDPLEALAALLNGDITSRAQQGWLQSLREVEQHVPSETQRVLDPHRVVQAMHHRMGPSDVLITDGGTLSSAATQDVTLSRPQLWLDSGPFGAAGAGLGYALGAAIGQPDSRVFATFGESAFRQHLSAFATLVQHGSRVLAVVGEDRGAPRPRSAPATSNDPGIQLDRVVQALGGRAYRVQHDAELESAFDRALEQPGPACIVIAPQAD